MSWLELERNGRFNSSRTRIWRRDFRYDCVMRNRLDKITLKGFKTIRELDGFEPGSLTVLIGPNGVGKSNFISFFRMLSWALADERNLPRFVGEQGGASMLLHCGPQVTREIEADLTLLSQAGENRYAFRLFYAAGDTLIYADERYRFTRAGFGTIADWTETGAGHSSPRLITSGPQDTTAPVIRSMLRKIIVHQFHDTSPTSRMRSKWDVDDNRWLREHAGNIAPVLLRLRENEPRCYRRIVNTIRLILPFFSDFELEPDYGRMLLSWSEFDSDRIYGASQASDGMLRVIALVTLLLLPEEDLPDVLVLDEPELGLHPFAINIVGGLIRAASTKVQVIAATQSTALVDCFGPEDIVIVERDGASSVFARPNPDELSEWLDDYTLSELWDKNVLGGRP